MSIGLKPYDAGGGAIQIGGTDAIEIDSSLNVTIPQDLEVSQDLVVTGTITSQGQVIGAGPAFSAYLSANQTVVSGVAERLDLNTKEFDTASCFNNTGSTVGGIPPYAFLPNVAGYYQVNFSAGGTASTSLAYVGVYIYKNGNAVSRNLTPEYTSTNGDTIGSRLVYMNGTTDYLEFYGQVGGTTTLQIVGVDGVRTSASAAFVRPA